MTFWLASCGRPQPTPEPETPAGSGLGTAVRPEAANQARAVTSTGGSATAASSATPAVPEPDSSAALPDESTPGAAPVLAPDRKPIEMITARDMAFLIDEPSSGLREAATAECEKSSKPDDAASLSACITKAREKFLPDVLRFEQGEQGNLVLSIYKRSGATLREVYVASVTLSDEANGKVKVTIRGREQGQRPLFRTGSGLVEVPNEYSLIIDDPKYGRLTYNAKIGVLGQR
jgi:hypothetical protein